MTSTTHTEGDGNASGLAREWRSRNTGPTRDLLTRDSDAFLHQALSTPCLNTIAKAEGIWIEDTAGRRYMDFHGNSVHHIGYGHPRLIAAIKDQLDTLSFSPRRYTNEVSVELAERLADRAPGDLGKVLFTTGGSDANEVALRLARMATGRFKTLSFWDSFHGAGFGASAVGGEATFRSRNTGPLLPGAEHIAPFNCTACAYGHTDPAICGLPCASMVEYVLGREGDIAAVIAEPMRATPTLPPPGYWHAVRDACTRHGTLLIMDEIPTGLGKTGAFFAFDHDGITPDIITLGKALGGGTLPIAAVIARRDLDIAGDAAIGHYTHEKNPVTARAALTTLDIIADENLVERSAQLGRHALERLHNTVGDHHAVTDIRGRGLMFGIALSDAYLAERVFYACLDAGLSFKISAGTVLTLSPPLTITQDQLDDALTIVGTALDDL